MGDRAGREKKNNLNVRGKVEDEEEEAERWMIGR